MDESLKALIERLSKEKSPCDGCPRWESCADTGDSCPKFETYANRGIIKKQSKIKKVK